MFTKTLSGHGFSPKVTADPTNENNKHDQTAETAVNGCNAAQKENCNNENTPFKCDFIANGRQRIHDY